MDESARAKLFRDFTDRFGPTVTDSEEVRAWLVERLTTELRGLPADFDAAPFVRVLATARRAYAEIKVTAR